MVLVAAALLLQFASPSKAGVRVEGLPPWLSGAATRSMEAVWTQIDPQKEEAARLEIVRLVALRLFEGYEVGGIELEGQDLVLSLKSKSRTEWRIEAGFPALSGPLSDWMQEDWEGARETLGQRIRDLPLEALAWADSALRKEVAGILEAEIPGWQGNLIVRVEEGGATLKVGLVPVQPLVLAVNPKSTSSSLPSLVHSGVKDDLMAGLSPLIGLPVAWVAKHEKQVAEWASRQLQDESFVESLKVDIRVVLKAQPVTDLSVRMESRRYTVWAWVAGYAGTSDRYPEAGIHLGRKAQIFPRWDVELYGETLLYLNDWDLETRLGIRWSPWDRIWLGAERSWPDEATWWRAWFDGPVRSPYAWIRTSDDGELNFGVGYRLNENLSIELHYDSRDENSSSVRLVGNL
ncbi:MAG: hypothetical protein GX436_00210 [Synergistaceae bacterium]|nr:hypothetical protein [Synergistaceae bacterium]